MIHEPSMPPSKTLDDHAQELSATLRAAFETWLQAQNPNNEEMWIATDLLLKGIFGFVAPTLVQMLDLNERGAQTITQRFAQHLDQAIGRTSSMNHRPITAENVMPTCQLFLGWLAGDKAREQITALPQGQARAIVRQIKAVDEQYRELRARQSDLAQAMETLLSLVHQHLGEHETPLSLMVEAAGDEDEDEDDEDIDTLMPPLGEEEARLYRELPPDREPEDEEDL